MSSLTCHFFGSFIPLSMKTTAETLYSTETTGLLLYGGIQRLTKLYPQHNICFEMPFFFKFFM